MKLIVWLIVLPYTLFYVITFTFNFTLTESSMTTVDDSTLLLQRHGKAQLVLPNGTLLTINKALYSPRSSRMLLIFKDIQANKLHCETTEDHLEYLIRDMMCCIIHALHGQPLEKMTYMI